LLNLLGNAIKFTARGSVTLVVRLGPTTAANPVFDFSVIDTGPGISPEALPRLFQKFEQADTSTTRSYGGTGLGLAICKELAELMGGCISVSSELRKGSTFCFRVPMGLGQRPELGEGQTEGQRHSHRLRILCAEDGPTNQIIISSILQELGHEVEIAEHGLQAVRRLSERDFDLVLMDGRMPCMDGEEAARCIRSGGTEQLRVLSPDVTIVALTANAGKEDRARYLAAGMDGFLSKPIDEKELFDEIGRVISALRRAGRELPAIDSDWPPQGSSDAERSVAPCPAEAAPSFAPAQIPPSTESLDELFGVQERGASVSKAQTRLVKRVPASSGKKSSNDLMVRVAAAFVQDAPRRFRSAQDALDRGDAATAALEFHSLRGAAAYANLGALQDALAELEALADDEDLGALAQRIQQAESLLDAGVAFMDKIAGPRLSPPG
jgi:CheY-like chemotaxis protein